MALDREADVWRTRDGRAWRIGRDAEVAWIEENTEGGLAITSAIPPLFEAYATLEHPDTGEPGTRPSEFEDWGRHVASVIAVLSEHTAAQPWWLGFLEYGPSANIIFNDVPKMSLYARPAGTCWSRPALSKRRPGATMKAPQGCPAGSDVPGGPLVACLDLVG